MKNLILGLVVVVLVGGGAFFVLNKDDNTTNTTNNSNSATNESQTAETKKSTSDSPKLAAQTVGQEVDCSTFTLEELGSVWGVPFVDTDINKVSELSSAGGKLYSCGYNETDSGLGVTYSIEYREYPDEESAKQSIADTRSTEKYGDKIYYKMEEKSGVGDEAFFWSRATTEKNVNQQMYIRKGSVVFLLSGVNLAGVDDSYKDKLAASYKLHFE